MPRQVTLVAGAIAALVGGCLPAARPADAEPKKIRTPSGLDADVRGRGPPVVLVHGAFLDRRQWEPQRPLAQRLTLIRYDTRWHGRSAGATAPFSAADDLADVLDAAGVRRASIVGLSHGARIAVDFALAYPDRVDRLVLAAPDVAGYRPVDRPAFWTPLLEALSGGEVERATEILAGSPIMTVGPADTGWVRAVVREQADVFRQDPGLERNATPPALDRLGEIAAPTLIIVGDDDLRDIHRVADTLTSGIRGAQRISLANAAHLVNIAAAPAFNRLVGAFLRGEDPR